MAAYIKAAPLCEINTRTNQQAGSFRWLRSNTPSPAEGHCGGWWCRWWQEETGSGFTSWPHLWHVPSTRGEGGDWPTGWLDSWSHRPGLLAGRRSLAGGGGGVRDRPRWFIPDYETKRFTKCCSWSSEPLSGRQVGGGHNIIHCQGAIKHTHRASKHHVYWVNLTIK